MLPFRFDEAREGAPEKTIVLVELPNHGAPKMEVVPIETGRRLVEVTERLEDLPNRAAELAGSFVRVIVPVDEPTPGLLMRVIDALPAAIVVEVRPVVATTASSGQGAP